METPDRPVCAPIASGRVRAVIFDVDGVLVDSPHEPAWRDALDALMVGAWRELADRSTWSPGSLDHERYQRFVAGRPRLDGARTVLTLFGVPDEDGRRAAALAEAKQERVASLIERGEFRAFDDAIRFLLTLRRRGVYVAAASSSRNASIMLRAIAVDDPPGGTLADALDADLSGRPLPRGKPDPAIFLAAAEALHVEPRACIVVEDAPVGVLAAVAAGMRAIGVARDDNVAPLRASGADYVVETLDALDVDAVVGTG